MTEDNRPKWTIMTEEPSTKVGRELRAESSTRVLPSAKGASNQGLYVKDSTSNMSAFREDESVIEPPVEATSSVPRVDDAAPSEDAAQTFLSQGVRSLALKKYEEACDSLSRAVEALAEKWGELSPKSGDALMLYGKALLNNAIAQSAVLGGAPAEAAEKEEAVQAAVASSSSAGPATASKAQFHFGGDADDEEEEAAEQEQGQEEEEEEEEDAAVSREDDLEQAFIMLDTARSIWSKQPGEDAKMKLAECHRLLGDVATESEQFESAVEEYSTALSQLASILPPYHRSLSELHMLIALALDFVPNAVDRAVRHAESARSVLLLKIKQLQSLETKTEKDIKEIADINDLMSDVDMKIEDLKVVPEEEPKTEAEKALEQIILNATGPAKTQGIVNNLNNLVKKKKALEVDQGNTGKRKGTEDLTANGEAALGNGNSISIDEPSEKRLKTE